MANDKKISIAGNPALSEGNLTISNFPHFQADQADQAIDQAKVQLDAQNQQRRGSQFDQRLASQEKQTQARIDAAMQRELLKNRGG